MGNLAQHGLDFFEGQEANVGVGRLDRRAVDRGDRIAARPDALDRPLHQPVQERDAVLDRLRR
jgi:hypothetical protein